MNKNIIIVAGGKGLRMGADLPKQFIPVGGIPILMHTIRAFYEYDPAIKIVLVLPESHRNYWYELCLQFDFNIRHQIVIGGEARFHSVKNGLEYIESGIVGVHDGARPFVSKEMIERCFSDIEELKAVIPVIDSTDSLREVIDDKHSKIVDRSKYKLVQTPQVFLVDVLKKAYETDYINTFTDDASVVEAMGINITLVQGEVTNIKVTTPLDLKIGEMILNDKPINQ